MLCSHGIFTTPHKDATLLRDIIPIPTPTQVLLPLSYGNEPLRIPACEEQDTIVRGNPVGLPERADALVLPCSVTGVFTGTQQVDHPLYGPLTCASIAVTAAEELSAESTDWQADPSAQEIVETARLAGIIDETDGVALYQKLQQMEQIGCKTLVADATEMQPYATAAIALLRTRAKDCAVGLSLAARAVGARKKHIAVHLPWSLRRQITACLSEKLLYNVPNQYPVQRPAPVGCAKPVGVIGLAACLALYDAVYRLEPACTGVITVSGDGVAHPQNLRVPFGTPISELIAFCQPVCDDVQIVLGDAFTGIPTGADTPILPGATCVLVMRTQPHTDPGVCIGCGRCVQACHKGLLPYEIARQYENTHYMQLAALHPEHCDGCSACSVICPAARPLTATVQQAAAHNTVVLKWRPDDD